MLIHSLFLYNFCTTTRLNRRPSRFACREYSRKHKSSTFFHIATHFSNKRLYILTFLCNLAINIRYRLKRTREKRKNKQISTHTIHRVSTHHSIQNFNLYIINIYAYENRHQTNDAQVGSPWRCFSQPPTADRLSRRTTPRYTVV